MKKFFAVLLVCMLALTAFTGCGEAEDDGSATIKIGGIGPLTGDYSTYGKSVQQGAQIAVDEINEAGGVNGYKFELLFEDDQADPEKAVTAYATLMDEEMNVSMGGVTSGSCVAVTEEVVKDGLLMITPSGSQLECTQYDNCFRLCFQDPDQGKYSADFMKENAIGTKVAIIYDKSNDYSVGIYDSFVAEAAELGLEVVTTQAFTDQSNTDFSVQLQAVKSSGADVLFLPIYAQEAAYILTQADSIDLDVTFFGVDGMDGILEKIGADNVALTEGVMLLTPFAADSSQENVKAFVDAYKAAYNATPDQFAADGYDTVYAIAAAVEKAGVGPEDESFNEAVVAAMTEITVDGVTGTMTWTADGECQKTATAVVITDGAYVAYTK